MSEDSLWREAAAVLAAEGIADPQREARLLWRGLFAHADAAGAAARVAYLAVVARRAAREPLSHLLGYRDFYAHRFVVTSDVLDPRPDTETLVERALDVAFANVLDLGTGSGCILLSLLAARADATGIGVDLSAQALDVAQRNAQTLGVGARAGFVRSDWYRAVSGVFDLIVANPPYIAADEMAGLQPEVRLYEPRMALTDEDDGLSAYRIIVAGAKDHLTDGGRMLLEIGPTQAAAVSAMLAKAGFSQITVWPDLDGRDRVVGAVFA